MFHTGDLVVYGTTGVCRVEGITPGLAERWEGLVRTGTPG